MDTKDKKNVEKLDNVSSVSSVNSSILNPKSPKPGSLTILSKLKAKLLGRLILNKTKKSYLKRRITE